MKNLGIILIAVVLIGLASCSSNRFNTTRIQNLDFNQYKTYGWLPPIDSLSKDYFNNDIAKHNIMTTANQEIERRGLRYSKENPDILFRYVTIVNNKKRLVHARPYYGYGGPWGWYQPWGFYGYNYHPFVVGEQRLRYGHIILEAIDTKTKSVIWQARGTSEVNAPEKAINNLPKIVEGVMKKYPLQIK